MKNCHFSGSHLPKEDMDKINKTLGLDKKTYETHKMLALSTAHVSKDTAELMDANCVASQVYQKAEYGWFMAVPRNAFEMERIPKDAYSPELYNCLKFAYEQGFDWVMFDRDVEPISELETFDW